MTEILLYFEGLLIYCNGTQPSLKPNFSPYTHTLKKTIKYRSTVMSGQPYPKNYIDLLISNVGKMLAQANLGIR